MNDDILKTIIEMCREGKKEVLSSEIVELKKQLDILKNLLSKTQEEASEKSAEYWERAKMGKSFFIKGKMEKSYPLALDAITKILDILRGEDLTITIQKVQRNSKGEIIKITTYTGREQDLITKYNSKYKQVEYDLDESLKYLKEVEEKNKAVINHYANFYKIAMEHTKSTRSSTSHTGWRKRVNEGNIVEAYQRHLKMKHMTQELTENTIDDFTTPEVMILLYYSVGNVPWWKQGDIGYNQIKAVNNAKLASASSIRRVATKIIQLFSEEMEFDIKEFNELFTAQDQEQLLDISELTETEVKELLKEIKATGRFKGI